MHTAHCDCCRTSTGASSLEVLRAAGWAIIEHEPQESLVLLCPVCLWQRTRAVETVSEAVEAAYGGREIHDESPTGEVVTRRVGWFWS